jgi:DNA invertase Pin-like site-specific DNA recombinase
VILSGTPTCAWYIRTSTERQSTENQKPDLERLVSARGYKVVAVYEEQVSAAAKVRPKYDEMMGDAHAGKFGVLIVWSLDRLGRSMVGNLSAVLDLDRRGVIVVSVKEPWLDSHPGPTRQLLLGVLGWVAEQERLRIGERVKAGLARVKASGQQLGRPRTHINVSIAIALRNQGMSIRGIAKELGVASSIVHRTLAVSRQSFAQMDPQVGDPR